MHRIGAPIAGVVLAAAISLGLPPAWPAGTLPPSGPQPVAACPNTGELVIDDIKICYFTCPDRRTSIRIGAGQICPPFH